MARTRTITLTDAPPVTIVEAEWPIVAVGSADGTPDERSARTRSIRVRQHADGRAIVFGVFRCDTRWIDGACHVTRHGVVLASGADIVAAIRVVGAMLAEGDADIRHWRAAIQACIADLPAVAI